MLNKCNIHYIAFKRKITKCKNGKNEKNEKTLKKQLKTSNNLLKVIKYNVSKTVSMKIFLISSLNFTDDSSSHVFYTNKYFLWKYILWLVCYPNFFLSLSIWSWTWDWVYEYINFPNILVMIHLITCDRCCHWFIFGMYLVFVM